MSARFTQVGRQRALGDVRRLDRSHRRRASCRTQTPPRPQGSERNVVVTMWDWADPKAYLHDEIASDKRNPTVNPNGPIYGALEESADYMPVVDPKTNTASQIKLAPRDPKTPSSARAAAGRSRRRTGATKRSGTARQRSTASRWTSRGACGPPARIRKPQTPAWCQAGFGSSVGEAVPDQSELGGLIRCTTRRRSRSRPSTRASLGPPELRRQRRAVVLVRSRRRRRLVRRARPGTRRTTRRRRRAGARSSSTTTATASATRTPSRISPPIPTKDKRLNIQFYGDSPAPDGSVWGSVQGMPGALVRFVPGAHPPETALAEVYEVPWNNPKATAQGFAPRGMDVDSKGVVWTVLSSGQLASFDRRKCKGPLNGPTATGQHCPEGWTLYPLPGPNYKGAVENASADSAYYNFVDRFDMLGVGKDVPLATGNVSEGLLALVDGKFMTFRVPYPMGFFAKGIDGRIDNPNGGWKGKALYTPTSTRAPFHMEGGKGNTPQAREVPGAARSAGEVGRFRRERSRRAGWESRPFSFYFFLAIERT